VLVDYSTVYCRVDFPTPSYCMYGRVLVGGGGEGGPLCLTAWDRQVVYSAERGGRYSQALLQTTLSKN
jgi:hypothetical protein